MTEKPWCSPGSATMTTSATNMTRSLASFCFGQASPGRASAAATTRSGYSAVHEKIRGAIKPEKIPASTPPSDMQKRSEEHTSELQSPDHLVCRLLLEQKKQEHTK